MDDQQAQIDDFLAVVLRNLEKNGFPDNSVSFSLDKMYESASKRGFSFNKIRDLLKEKDIETELTSEHVIFKAAVLDDDEPDMAGIASAAQRMMQQMTAEQRAEVEKMMQEMKAEDLSAIQQQWEAIPAAEKLRMMHDMQKSTPD